jgi:hypothetical protein
MRYAAFLTLLALPLSAAELAVVVDGETRAEYVHRGTTYVEAVRGREYSLRISNPSPYRVAVALSVDGLNTIDARHTDAWSAAKWVLEPYESTEISGWQVSDRAARRFVFTGERDSYGAALGATQNLGVIEAVFYRERGRPERRYDGRYEQGAVGGAAPPSAASREKDAQDDYAATGMGDRTRHEVERVSVDLDPDPIAKMRIRYEFRPQLIKLGVLRASDPLDRRERAKGFERYCPEP